ncbi:hypothetical protein [Vibrio agarivorans]|uniref:hypothetical protein n=1 Tax=Vibrio agarivorans TaxID=153622 RepID=UPI0025B3035C|nr:hypothetical protein [Vibrio agarivorans]MDN3661179.1 hypothetical protein [Vibrio agarivorans]
MHHTNNDISKSAVRKDKCYQTINGIILSKRGRLLSPQGDVCKYSVRISIQCEFGHIWQPIANDVKNGHWCSVCGGNRKHTTESVKLFVRDRHNGKLLDNEFNGIAYTHYWQCKHGHIFQMKGRAVLNDKTWCPVCSKHHKQQKIRTKRFGELKQLIEQAGGKIISKQYVNSTTKIDFTCARGVRHALYPVQIKKELIK